MVNRYAHLLQPIRDLTQNWDIDVASELNDYLEELDQMCITFDEGKVRLNFAEAALLIQGSTCIYSKKVELLHSLVYQTVDYISNQNKKREKQAGASGINNASGVEASDDADDCLTFQPLEINTVKTQEPESGTVVHVTLLPPECLIRPDTHERHKFLLISLKGEVLGSLKDFRMNTFIPGDQDLILFNSHTASYSDIADHWHSTDSLAQSRHPPANEASEDHGAQVANDDGGDDGGVNFLPIEDNCLEMDHMPEEHINRHKAPSKGRMLQERDDVRPTEKEQAENVWRLQDPYAVLGEDQPLKTGKCYKVPDGLGMGKRKRKGSSVLPSDLRSWLTGTYDRQERKLKNGPAFTDLNYIYYSAIKDKLKTLRRTCRKGGVAVPDEELEKTYLQPQEGDGELPQETLRDLQGVDEDNSDNEHDPLPHDFPAENCGAPAIILSEIREDEPSYEDLVKKCVEQYLISSAGWAQETALSQRVKDWEDKIHPMLELQERCPAFDIHDYGDRIVEGLGAVGHRRSFASIVGGMDNFEACKYMLASLQLANDHTVEIDKVDGLEENVDTMGLTLLSTHRANDRFKTLAPST